MGGSASHLNPRDDGTPRVPYGWLIFLTILSIVIITLWFREEPTGPLHQTRVAVRTVATPLEATGVWLTSPARNFVYWVSDLGVTRSELQEISNQNDELRARVIELEEMRLTDERLTALMSAVPTGTPENQVLPATVIGLPGSSYQDVIVLNRGTRQGVDLGMPVVTAQGLLGATIEVGPNYSKVRLISDQQSGVAALVQRGRHLGVVRGSLSGELMLDFVRIDVDVEEGDVIITSGLGGVFPKGILIGEVLRVNREGNALYQTIVIHSPNSMTLPEEVLILLDAPPSIDNLPDPERRAIGIGDN